MSLRERRDILSLAQSASGGVLVTLVRATGSSYRQPGARLLALPDGRTAGTISGGCLEADLLRKAHWYVRHGAVLRSYDTGFDDDAEIPFGLGCGGLVDLLLEDRNTPEAAATLDAMQASLRGEPRTVVTQLPSHSEGFARIVLDRQRDVLFATATLATDRIVDLRAAARGRSTQDSASNHLFIERLDPAQRLVLCGAGEDAKPVARLAAQLGWTVLIADGRPQHATADRFPEADAVYITRKLAPLAPACADAVVLMTHSFEQDRAFLTELLALAPEQQPRYVGLLGARHRSALLLQQAAAANHLFLEAAVSRVHAPIGLELGGEGPESIALAIVAEVQAALHPSQAGTGAVMSRRMSAADAANALERFPGAREARQWCALDAELPAFVLPAIPSQTDIANEALP